MTPVALSFAVLQATDRTKDLATALAANSLTLLVGGAVGDRVPRGPLLVAANLATERNATKVVGPRPAPPPPSTTSAITASTRYFD